MSSERFERDKDSTGPGPGSYEIPAALDDHGAVILAGCERFQDAVPDSPAKFYVYEDAGKVPSVPLASKPIRKGLALLTAKENRCPNSSTKEIKKDLSKGTPRAQLSEDAATKQEQASCADAALQTEDHCWPPSVDDVIQGWRRQFAEYTQRTARHFEVLIKAQDNVEERADQQAELFRADLAAAAKREASLRQELHEAKASSVELAELRGRLFTAEEAMKQALERNEALSIKAHRAEELDEVLHCKSAQMAELEKASATLQNEANSWKVRATAAEHQIAVLRHQEEELQTLAKMTEEQGCRNKELLTTIQAFRKDVDLLKAENRQLREAEAAQEEDRNRDLEKQAEVSGHTNHKQKIHYMQKLKKLLLEARADVKKAQQKAALLEAHRPDQGFVSFTPRSERPSSASPLTRTASTPSLGGTRGRRQTFGGDRANVTVEEALRRCQIKERELEGLRTDYEHLLALLGRAAQTESAQGKAFAEALLSHLRATTVSSPISGTINDEATESA